jgi:hypothetical protein
MPQPEPTEYREIPVGAVYPSEKNTVFALTNDDDVYGGAHVYRGVPCGGFENGETVYDETVFLPILQFVKKNPDGTTTFGWQSEQLVLALIDRHEKMNAQFPSEQHAEQMQCLRRFLELCKERIDDRIPRGVMGKLEK